MRILEGAADFSVGKKVLWTVRPEAGKREPLFSYPLAKTENGVRTPTGQTRDYTGWKTHELWCSEWKDDGSLTKEKRIFSPSDGEWIEPFDLTRGSLQKHVTGDMLYWKTVSPGDSELIRNRFTGYFSARQHTDAVSAEIVYAGEN